MLNNSKKEKSNKDSDSSTNWDEIKAIIDHEEEKNENKDDNNK